ncbi:hypothetical protein [Parapedobacter koreensis]|uniref:hypothetical protein n=1 Tax=Parapedobacter koreensis TaxID=332977 RepID=UPI000ABB9340|nr:hypothetical protein [Parapedobacter koreensis]
MNKKNITGTQDKSRNMEMGNTTADKTFRDTKTQKRHQGLPNAGGVRTGQTKKNK